MRKSNVYGQGRVYKPTYVRHGKRKQQNRYWIAFSRHGKPFRENAKTSVFAEAVLLLQKRLAGVETPEQPKPEATKLTIADLIALIESDYEREGRRSILTLRRSRFPHLTAYFKDADVSKLDKAAIELYRDHRKEEKAANGTVNREVNVIRRALQLACDRNQVTAVPRIKNLKENTPRTGFFEWDTFQALLAQVDVWWRELYTVAYVTGWRVDDELCPLTWTQIDFMNKSLRLDAGTTKNDEGRNFPFTPLLETALKAQRARVDALQRKKDRIIPWVFPRSRTSAPLTSAYKPFKKAANAAGLARLQHDFRRTAVRNLENAGVPRPTAKRMVGHKTDSMYERYNIVDKKSMDVGRDKLAAYEAMTIAFAEAAKAQ